MHARLSDDVALCVCCTIHRGCALFAQCVDDTTRQEGKITVVPTLRHQSLIYN